MDASEMSEEERRMIAAVEESAPGSFEKFVENGRWFFNNKEGLREEYGGMFVAVYDRAVCMSDRDLTRLNSRAGAKYGANAGIVVQFVEKEEMTLVV